MMSILTTRYCLTSLQRNETKVNQSVHKMQLSSFKCFQRQIISSTLSYSQYNTSFPGSHIILEINSINWFHVSIPFLCLLQVYRNGTLGVYWVNPLTTNIPHHIEASQLIWNVIRKITLTTFFSHIMKKKRLTEIWSII